MHKLTVTLKQHTPLIHFQHSQEGATLRASEVKPKLDKFIIERCFHNNFDECKEFLVGYSEKNEQSLREKFNEENKPYRALNYKMRIEGSDNVSEFLLASYISNKNKDNFNKLNIQTITPCPFFAQEKENGEIKNSQDWDNIPKKGLLDNEVVVLNIIATNNVLAHSIATYIQDFFAKENFGTRQSKGFGCFSVCSINLNDQSFQIANFDDLIKRNFKFVYKKQLIGADLSIVFGEITSVYKRLKSGNNYPYSKSLLMLYFLEKDIRWEKRYIKYQSDGIFEKNDKSLYLLKDSHEGHNWDDVEDETYKYIRACLGVAEHFEFQLENPAKDNGKLIAKIRNKSIERYKSPIQFIVNDNAIYLAGDDVDNRILNEIFSFEVSIEGDKDWQNADIGKIKTPKEFDLSSFISYAMKKGSLGYKKI